MASRTEVLAPQSLEDAPTLATKTHDDETPVTEPRKPNEPKKGGAFLWTEAHGPPPSSLSSLVAKSKGTGTLEMEDPDVEPEEEPAPTAVRPLGRLGGGEVVGVALDYVAPQPTVRMLGVTVDDDETPEDELPPTLPPKQRAAQSRTVVMGPVTMPLVEATVPLQRYVVLYALIERLTSPEATAAELARQKLTAEQWQAAQRHWVERARREPAIARELQSGLAQARRLMRG